MMPPNRGLRPVAIAIAQTVSGRNEREREIIPCRLRLSDAGRSVPARFAQTMLIGPRQSAGLTLGGFGHHRKPVKRHPEGQQLVH